jgi:hypothetical protein
MIDASALSFTSVRVKFPEIANRSLRLRGTWEEVIGREPGACPRNDRESSGDGDDRRKDGLSDGFHLAIRPTPGHSCSRCYRYKEYRSHLAFSATTC